MSFSFSSLPDAAETVLKALAADSYQTIGDIASKTDMNPVWVYSMLVRLDEQGKVHRLRGDDGKVEWRKK